MAKMPMPGVVVTQGLTDPDRLPSDEVIKADNVGRLQSYIASYLRKCFKAKFLGRPNTKELQHAMKAVLVQTTRQLEVMGVINPNEHDVDVREDTWLDCQERGDPGPPDPALLHISVKPKKRPPEPKKE